MPLDPAVMDKSFPQWGTAVSSGKWAPLCIYLKQLMESLQFIFVLGTGASLEDKGAFIRLIFSEEEEEE